MKLLGEPQTRITSVLNSRTFLPLREFEKSLPSQGLIFAVYSPEADSVEARRMRGVKTRITRLEHAAKARGIFDPDCICFPEKEQPFVGFYVELDIAAAVKCPLHGERFNRNVFFVYVSKWLREKLWNHLWTNHSPQYRKAWFASFPRELWPAEEILVEGTTCLRLKNGTLVSLTSGGDQ